MKKTLIFFMLLALMPFANAADFAAFSAEMGDAVSEALAGAVASAGSSSTYKYNYTPVVFELTTEYYRNLYQNMGEDIDGNPTRANMNYKQEGLFGEGAGYFKAKCYGTLINKNYLLTHKNCIYLPDMDYVGADIPGGEIEWEPLNMTFARDGGELYYNMKNVKTVFVDDKSGAVLLDLSKMCFSNKKTTASNVCVSIWEYFFGGETKFDIKKDYGTVILTNIDANDNIADAFKTRNFFSPLDNTPRIPADVKAGVMSLSGKVKKGYVGEPIFHKANGNMNILVAIRTNDVATDLEIGSVKSNKYALFSSDFTKHINSKVKKEGIKLTKDLKGQTSL